jgi:hypothetical protein
MEKLYENESEDDEEENEEAENQDSQAVDGDNDWEGKIYYIK